MPPRALPEAPSPPLPSATGAAPGILHLHSRTRPPASSVSPHVHSSGPPFPPVFSVPPYQPSNDRHVNGHRFPRQQSAGDLFFQVCAAEQDRVSMVCRRNEEMSAWKEPKPER